MERPKPELGTQGDVLGKRIVAVVVDLVLLALVSGLITAPLAAISPRIGGPLGSLISTVVAFAYFTFMEGTYGQTLGKKILNLVVVEADGGDCTIGGAAIRNLLRYIDWLPFFYLVGIVVIYLTDDNQRLGDVAADTVVVREATDDVTPPESAATPEASTERAVKEPTPNAETHPDGEGNETKGTTAGEKRDEQP